ncbi:MAG: Flp pilus assembly complex ATPase component TadA [Candidatus Omnitrophica bacterium]|nr:Flp pilus assembly complex ATPase component TadA [Candidatus Omnitrophota bacterium]
MSKKSDIVLAEALADKGLMTRSDLDALLQEADRSTDSLQQILLKRQALPERDILVALGEKLKIPYVELHTIEVEKAVLGKVPVKVASYYGFVPLAIKGRNLVIAVSSPLEIKIQDEIRTQLGYGIEVALATQAELTTAMKKCYGLGADTIGKIVSAAEKQAAPATSATRQAVVEDIQKMAGDASVIRLVNQILLEGWQKRATDIHIEPQRNGVKLRYRIDGLLYDAPMPPDIQNFLSAIISRIKIMSNLNIVERRLPQDGRAIVRVQDQALDLRISTIPTPFGESVVIRLLPAQMLFSLEKLGLSKNEVRTLENLIQKPHGIIFVTGPTGSGKTTTLYACLSRINTRERKIITLEDPIEYEMEGITQIQVMPEIEFDFARGLRSVLRHDPDVIMVGEVRDLETAEIAIRVALTGHLVFSTLHTNDAASGISRLIDIGVEPYLLASSVEEFIAQRLIRSICPQCKYEDKGAAQELKTQIARDLGLKTVEEVKIYRGKGCANCNQTGFFGRSAIYEMLEVDDEIEELIVQKVPSNQIKRVALSKGMRTLRQDGWQKVIAGITTPEEVVRTTSAEKEETLAARKMFIPPGAAPEAPPLSGADRRTYPRRDTKVNIRFKIFRSKDEALKRGVTSPPEVEQLSVTTNISAAGMVFIAREPVAAGSVLELKIELPNSEEPVECLAKVLRVEDVEEEKTYNVTVNFLDISGAQRTKLNKYVESERG